MRDPEEIDLDDLPESATVETIDDRSGLLDLSDDSGFWEPPVHGAAWYVAAAVAGALLTALALAALLG